MVLYIQEKHESMILKTKLGEKLTSVELRTGEAMSYLEKFSLKGIISHIKKVKQPKELLYLVTNKVSKRETLHTVSG